MAGLVDKECGLNKSKRKCPGTVSEYFCPIDKEKCPKNSDSDGKAIGRFYIVGVYGFQGILKNLKKNTTGKDS